MEAADELEEEGSALLDISIPDGSRESQAALARASLPKEGSTSHEMDLFLMVSEDFCFDLRGVLPQPRALPAPGPLFPWRGFLPLCMFTNTPPMAPLILIAQSSRSLPPHSGPPPPPPARSSLPEAVRPRWRGDRQRSAERDSVRRFRST